MGLYMEKQKIENWKGTPFGVYRQRTLVYSRRDEVQLPNGNVIPAYYVLEYPAWFDVTLLLKKGG